MILEPALQEPRTSGKIRTQIVVPIYNEGENVIRLYEGLKNDGVEYDLLKFVYDFDQDNTLPFIARLAGSDPRVIAEKNQFGRGVLNALKWGFSRVEDGPVVILMGDNSDKLDVIPKMIDLWSNGATIVSPSRYMPGGEKHGGGVLKTWMSRTAGKVLGLIGFPTTDPTNNFKMYDGAWLRKQEIESVGGFEVALELSYKAYVQDRKIVEFPTVWYDRTEGVSKFKILKWLPHYLKWFLRCVAAVFGSALFGKRGPLFRRGEPGS